MSETNHLCLQRMLQSTRKQKQIILEVTGNNKQRGGQLQSTETQHDVCMHMGALSVYCTCVRAHGSIEWVVYVCIHMLALCVVCVYVCTYEH